MTNLTGISHLALTTADLDRFRRFYEGLLGIPMGFSLRMDHPPFLRHATFHLPGAFVLHVFEVPGYDPTDQGIGSGFGERGRLDHFGLMLPDEAALRELAERLRAAGATDGEVSALGPVLSVRVVDPDGLELELNCPNLAFDPDGPGEVVEEVGLPGWFEQMQAEVLTASGRAPA